MKLISNGRDLQEFDNNNIVRHISTYGPNKVCGITFGTNLSSTPVYSSIGINSDNKFCLAMSNNFSANDFVINTINGNVAIGKDTSDSKLDVRANGNFSEDILTIRKNNEYLIMNTSVDSSGFGQLELFNDTEQLGVGLKGEGQIVLRESTFTGTPSADTGVFIVSSGIPFFKNASGSEYNLASQAIITSATLWKQVGSHINYTSGNVGIGITTPSEKLNVIGNIKVSQTSASVISDSIKIITSDNVPRYEFFENDATLLSTIEHRASDAPALQSIMRFSSVSSPIAFVISGNEHMRVHETGNLSIGTQNDFATLNVDTATLGVNSTHRVRFIANRSDGPGAYINNVSTGGHLQVSDYFVLDNNKRMGLGVVTPSNKFDILETTDTNVIQTLYTNGFDRAAGFSIANNFGGASPNYATVGINTDNNLHIGMEGTFSTNHLVITSAGNVGMGIIPPTDIHSAYVGSLYLGQSSNIMPHNAANQVFINSNAYYNSSSQWKLINDGFAQSLLLDSNTGFRFSTTDATALAGATIVPTSKFEILNNGNVGINVTTPTFRFHTRSNSTNYNDHMHEHYSSGNYYAYQGFRRSKSDTLGAHATTVVNDYLGGTYFYGNNGSTFTNGAYIHAVQDGTASTTTPTRIELATSDGSNWINRMVIDRNGAIGVGIIPNVWNSGYRGFQVEGMSMMANTITYESNFLCSNLYYDTSNVWRYVGAGKASLYSMSGGAHGYYNCIAGTAGAAATLNYIGGFNESGTLGLWSAGFTTVNAAYKHSIVFGSSGWMYSQTGSHDLGLANNLYVSVAGSWTIKNSGDYGSMVHQNVGNITFFHTSTTSGTATMFANAAFLRQGGLQMANAVAIPTYVANNAQLYVTGGEMYVQDDSGNATQISPHNNDGEWIYNSKNKKTGKHININMEKMIRFLEKYHGEKFIEIMENI